MKHKSILILTLFLCHIFCLSAQSISNYQSVELRAGKSMSAGEYAALSYRHTTDYLFDISLSLFLESLHKYSLRYSTYGLELKGEYYTALGEHTDHLFECKIGAGFVSQIEKEPWIYPDQSFLKRLNYGLVAELTGEWNVSQNFSLTAFTQQKLLFAKKETNTGWIFGLGIKLNLDN